VVWLKLNGPDRLDAFSPAMPDVLGGALHRETMTIARRIAGGPRHPATGTNDIIQKRGT
jgi:hypothetical protein